MTVDKFLEWEKEASKDWIAKNNVLISEIHELLKQRQDASCEKQMHASKELNDRISAIDNRIDRLIQEMGFIERKIDNYEYRVFDVIVDLLLSQGGRARKGNGRSYRLGESNCDEKTVVGAVALDRGNKNGDSVFDPVFVLAAVLKWADIAHNERGELVLTQQYRSTL